MSTEVVSQALSSKKNAAFALLQGDKTPVPVGMSEEEKSKRAQRRLSMVTKNAKLGQNVFSGIQSSQRTHAPYQIKLKRWIKHRWFEGVIQLCIVISSISLALEYPGVEKSDPSLSSTLRSLDLAFNIIFTAEMILKCSAFGATGYLEQGWNRLDALVVVSSWISTILSTTSQSGGVGPVRTFRLLRTLRPLRSIQRLPGLRIVINSIIECVPTFTQILFVLLVVYFIFGILFMQVRRV